MLIQASWHAYMCWKMVSRSFLSNLLKVAGQANCSPWKVSKAVVLWFATMPGSWLLMARRWRKTQPSKPGGAIQEKFFSMSSRLIMDISSSFLLGLWTVTLLSQPKTLLARSFCISICLICEMCVIVSISVKFKDISRAYVVS